jgi:ribosomal protein S18 acetylase RimI-like enzyme
MRSGLAGVAATFAAIWASSWPGVWLAGQPDEDAGTRMTGEHQMDKAAVRRGRPSDAEDFSKLALHTGPELLPALFGPTVRVLWRNAFRHPRSCFSFEHSRFVEVNGRTAGMALSYDFDRKRGEELRSLVLILRYLRWRFPAQITYLRRSSDIVAQIAQGDHYLSNIAVYPELRCLGYGAILLAAVEEEARQAGSKRMVLDVESDHERALRFYVRLGYAVESQSPPLRTRRRDFEFFKMTKSL